MGAFPGSELLPTGYQSKLREGERFVRVVMPKRTGKVLGGRAMLIGLILLSTALWLCTAYLYYYPAEEGAGAEYLALVPGIGAVLFSLTALSIVAEIGRAGSYRYILTNQRLFDVSRPERSYELAYLPPMTAQSVRRDKIQIQRCYHESSQKRGLFPQWLSGLRDAQAFADEIGEVQRDASAHRQAAAEKLSETYQADALPPALAQLLNQDERVLWIGKAESSRRASFNARASVAALCVMVALALFVLLSAAHEEESSPRAVLALFSSLLAAFATGAVISVLRKTARLSRTMYLVEERRAIAAVLSRKGQVDVYQQLMKSGVSGFEADSANDTLSILFDSDEGPFSLGRFEHLRITDADQALYALGFFKSARDSGKASA